jgi:hypothetical protein
MAFPSRQVCSFRLPRWVPYRLRDTWDSIRIDYHVNRIQQTAPVPVVSNHAAQAELFMQLCRRDLWMGVVACKSLLRHCPGLLHLTLIDDGSLSEDHRRSVASHLPGLRWLRAGDAIDPRSPVISGRPHLAALPATGFVLAPKLIYPSVYARSNKVIILDPDTVFLARPESLLQWIAGGAEALYLHDHQRDERGDAPGLFRSQLLKLQPLLAPGRRWRLDHYYFNSGLLAFQPSALDFDIAERFLAWLESADPELKTGACRVWFGSWTPEQTCYMLMFAYLDPPAVPFGREYRIGDAEGGTFCHFLRDGLVKNSSLRILERFVANCL